MELILAGDFPREDELDGRIPFVGAGAAGVLDQRATPLVASCRAIEVHAQIIRICAGRLTIWCGRTGLRPQSFPRASCLRWRPVSRPPLRRRSSAR